MQQYAGKEGLLAFDPGCISKSGKHTPGLAYLQTRSRHPRRSGCGCTQAMKKGLEIAGIAFMDLMHHTAFHYQATQTIVTEGESLLTYFAKLITSQAAQLPELSKYVVVDACFSKHSFVEAITALGLQLITRLRHDSVVFYPYLGAKGKGRERPKKYAGKVKVKQLDTQYGRPCLQEEDFTAFQALLCRKALKRLLNVVIVDTYKKDGSIKSSKIFASTHTCLAGCDLWL